MVYTGFHILKKYFLLVLTHHSGLHFSILVHMHHRGLCGLYVPYWFILVYNVLYSPYCYKVVVMVYNSLYWFTLHAVLMRYRIANPEATWDSYSSSEWEQLILRCVSSEGPSLGLPGRRGSVVTAVAKVTSVFPGPSVVKVISIIPGPSDVKVISVGGGSAFVGY